MPRSAELIFRMYSLPLRLTWPVVWHASCNRAAIAYLLSGHRAVEAALRFIPNPVMPGLVIVVLAVGCTAATRLWSAADVL